MIYISHRGNLEGPTKDFENKPEYIENAISQGYEVEIDVWFKNNNFFLGHDEPQYNISANFLLKKEIWCHAKNLKALEEMKKIGSHYFWHENDKFTLTSKGYIWTYPGFELSKNSICVLPEQDSVKNKKLECAGICSDFIKRYKFDKINNI